MTWRERIALLLGAATPFAVAGPAAAALPTAGPLLDGRSRTAPTPLEFWSDPAHAGHLLQLTGHSSHRSHSSHSSHVSGAGHASHYSGSSVTLPTYTPPAPAYWPAPPPPLPRPAPPPVPLYSPPKSAPQTTPASPTRQAPAPAAKTTPRLTQDDINLFVQRVQIALMVKGYDPGPADGELKPKTRDALKAYQGASGLEASGNMDMPTLHALGVLK